MDIRKENDKIRLQPESTQVGLPHPKSQPSTSGRGGSRYSAQAYTPLHGDDGRTGTGRRKWWWAFAAALVLAAAIGTTAYYRHVGPTQTASSNAAHNEKRVLFVSPADVDNEATQIAKNLLATTKLKPAPPEPAPASIAALEQHASTPGTHASPARQTGLIPPRTATRQPQTAGAQSTRAAKTAPAPKSPEEKRQEILAILENAPQSTRVAIASGEQKLYTLHIFDDEVEDGDAVILYVNGASYGQISLLHKGKDVTIPLPLGTESKIHVLARIDGDGGGVTFAAHSSLGEARSRAMWVGESDNWTVIAK